MNPFRDNIGSIPVIGTFLRIGSIPVIGTFLRYLYWLITCPIRINRLLREIKNADIHRLDLMQDEVLSHSGPWKMSMHCKEMSASSSTGCATKLKRSGKTYTAST